MDNEQDYIPQQPEYVTCPNCGAHNSPRANCCVACGERLPNGRCYCPNCGRGFVGNVKFCDNCGTETLPGDNLCKQSPPPAQTVYVSSPSVGREELISKKSRTAALLICFFFGFLGIHRFYVGKVGTGILWLLTAGCFGIGWIIDFIMIACGSFTDSYGYRITDWGN